jgi:hypothetical protein
MRTGGRRAHTDEDYEEDVRAGNVGHAPPLGQTNPSSTAHTAKGDWHLKHLISSVDLACSCSRCESRC